MHARVIELNWANLGYVIEADEWFWIFVLFSILLLLLFCFLFLELFFLTVTVHHETCLIALIMFVIYIYFQSLSTFFLTSSHLLIISSSNNLGHSSPCCSLLVFLWSTLLRWSLMLLHHYPLIYQLIKCYKNIIIYAKFISSTRNTSG